MKTNNGLRTALSLLVVTVIGGSVKAQWISGGGGRQYLTNPTEGVRVGTTTTTPPSALTVNGDEMSTPTGEVFRTDAPSGSTTSWRLLRGGTERGRLFSLNSDNHFHMDAMDGDMRFWTQGTERMRMNSMLTGAVGWTIVHAIA